RSSAGTGGLATTTGTTGNCAGASSPAPRGRRARTGTTAITRGCALSGLRSARAAHAAKSQASDIALAHRSVPGGLDLTGRCVDCNAVVWAVVEENVGVGHTTDRAVLVVDRRGLPGHTVQIVVAPLALHRREIHRLGVDEFRALDGVFGADAGARIH